MVSFLRVRDVAFRGQLHGVRRRPAALLLGASLLVYASPAFAQNECGAPPPGGGTVTCTTDENPYPDGIEYLAPTDLTVVLEPGVVVAQGVTLLSGAFGVDLRLEAAVDTQISSTETGSPFGDGVGVVGSGSVYVAVDDVDTAETQSSGIFAQSGTDAIVIADTVQTSGDVSSGIVALRFPLKYTGGDISVTANSVTTQGDASGGIHAASLYGGGTDISVSSGTVSTSGDNSPGIVAVTIGGPDYGSGGNITITSGSVTTAGVTSTGLLAETAGGAINITSGSVSTIGDGSAGIFATVTEGGDPPPVDLTVTGTHVAAAPEVSPPDIAITSISVVTTGDDSPGLRAITTVGDIYIESGSVETAGDVSDGIDAITQGGSIAIGSTSLSTTGDESIGIAAIRGVPECECPDDTVTALAVPTLPADGIAIDSGSVTTTGAASTGILAQSKYGTIDIDSGTVSTSGEGADGIVATTAGGEKYGGGAVSVTSDSVTTIGTDSVGIEAGGSGNVTVDSGIVSTSGANSIGISAVSENGDVVVTSDQLTTGGDLALGIFASSVYGSVTVTNTDSIETAGQGATGITAQAFSDRQVTVDSAAISTIGDNSVGIDVRNFSGDILVISDAVATSGDYSTGIFVETSLEDNYAEGIVDITSGTVATAGDGARGIAAYGGSVVIVSGSVTTTGPSVESEYGAVDSSGIYARAFGLLDEEIEGSGGVTVTSGSVSTAGDDSDAIRAAANYGNVAVTSTGTASTSGDNAHAIYATSGAQTDFGDGTVTVTSNIVTTAGDGSNGILAVGHAAVTATSTSASTAGNGSGAIEARSTGGDVVVTSGSASTQGTGSNGIEAVGFHLVSVTSTSVTTTGANSAGILATQLLLDGGGGGDSLTPSSAGADLMAQSADDVLLQQLPGDGVLVTSGSVTTGGANSPGISAHAYNGDVEVVSTGTVTTTGADSPGIIAISDTGFVIVDAAAVNSGGTGSDAILVDSATNSTVTIRGLVQSANGFALQAQGGTAAVGTTAPGTIRGRIDLTGGNDTFANAGTFDAIGTSLFGAGADVLTNSGTVRSVNGQAVLSDLETFNNNGLVTMADGAANDRLTVGNFVGQTGSTLRIDVDFATSTADVLVTGLATGTTVIEAQGGNAATTFTSQPILLVDAGAGTAATAFTLTGAHTTQNAYITRGLIFDAPNFDFLLANAPNQPIFETALVSGMTIDIWHQSADAVEHQLETARAPSVLNGGNNLTSSASAGGWIQLYGGEIDRDATQSFTVGTTTTNFDVSYEQNFEGLQAGVDFDRGDAIFGFTFGIGRSDTNFETSPSTLQIDSKNLGAYAAFASGSFYANLQVKADWMDLETNPGAGLAAEFDATAYGARAVAGFRFDLGRLFAEPSASLTWVQTDVEDYQSGGATISFDGVTSLRGTAGIRIGGLFATGESGVFSPFAGIRVVEEFDGDSANDFLLGSTIVLQEEGPGTHAEASAGLSFTSGSFEAFLRGEMDFGSEIDGRTFRAGVRLRF